MYYIQRDMRLIDKLRMGSVKPPPSTKTHTVYLLLMTDKYGRQHLKIGRTSNTIEKRYKNLKYYTYYVLGTISCVSLKQSIYIESKLLDLTYKYSMRPNYYYSGSVTECRNIKYLDEIKQLFKMYKK